MFRCNAVKVNRLQGLKTKNHYMLGASLQCSEETAYID